MRLRDLAFIAALFVIVFTLATCVLGEEPLPPREDIVLYPCQPDDTLAILSLVEQFDSQRTVWRFDPVLIVQPEFVSLAISASKLDGADVILTAVLASEELYSRQQRLAAAIGLEAMGEKAAPEVFMVLPDLLSSEDAGENIMALGILRGLGPLGSPCLEAVRSLLSHENFHVRYWACRAIGAMEWRASDAAGDLCALLEGGEPASVRRNACIALGKVAGCSPDLPRVNRILTDLVNNDPCYPVKVAANDALLSLFGNPLPDDDGEPTLVK